MTGMSPRDGVEGGQGEGAPTPAAAVPYVGIPPRARERGERALLDVLRRRNEGALFTVRDQIDDRRSDHRAS